MDQDVKKYADSLYESARMESGRTLRDARVKLQQEMAARNSGYLPLSGVDIQAMVRLYVAHVDRCTTARFESYQQAYDQTGRAASDQDLTDILEEFKAVWAQEKRHSASAIAQFITSRGPAPSPIGSFKALIDSGSAEGHDRVLGRLKIWRAKPRRPAPAAASGGKKSDGYGVKDDDRRFALLAIEEARKSVPEDERPHPKVGALIVKDGNVLSQAHRGEKPKSHAEYVALEDKLPDDLVAGATVYTTLEPCTTRKHPKIPCAQRLIDRKIGRVVIGMPDPNPDIRGRGDQLLSDAGIEVQLFPRDLRAQVEEMNRDFIRAQKQRQTAIGPETVESDPKEFLEQRKRLPETELLRRIWSKPYWHVYIRPTQFKKARFQDADRCRQFVVSSQVRIGSGFGFPSFLPENLETDDEWVAGEFEYAGRTHQRAERWGIFRSGQFVQTGALYESRVHVIDVLDIATAAFEFAARMADVKVLYPEAAITLELHGVAGHSLTWPQDLFGYIDAVGRECWCQDEVLKVERRVTPEELKARRRDLAIDFAVEIYSKFGWTELPLERLQQEQQKRFSSA